jgi:integrase
LGAVSFVVSHWSIYVTGKKGIGANYGEATQGTIEWRRLDLRVPKGLGHLDAQIRLEHDQKKRKRAGTQRQARELLRQMQSEHERGVNLGAQQPTVVQWCQTWLETFAINLKPNIKADYAGVIRRTIASAPIGRRRLDQLTPADVQAWVNDLAKKVAPQTVRNAHARLHKALAVAVRQRYVARNVADDTELPPVRRKPIYPLDFEQAAALLDAVDGHRWAALYRLAINLGLREGELLGLTWEVLDFKAKTLRIDQQLQRVDGAFVLQTTKTKAGERVLMLDDDLIAVLRTHWKNMAEERLLSGSTWKDKLNLVFVSETGGPIHVSCLLDHFRQMLKRAGLPSIRFHDLRHTAATLMLANNEPLVTVSKILGHSSPAVTATIYAHALDSSKASAIAALSQRLRKAQ